MNYSVYDVGMMALAGMFNITLNETTEILTEPMYYSVAYIIIGFISCAIIFLVGLAGNIMVVIVVARTRSMHSPTNCYLVSLAIADILLLVSAPLPTMVEYFLIIEQFVFGRIGCSVMVFIQYLGLNVSSLSITVFTIERYIAICHPIRAQTICTVSRAKRIIIMLWAFGIVYCTPWLFVTTTRTRYFVNDVSIQICTYKLKRKHYVTFYMADLVIFYLVPLVLTVILYGLIGHILFKSDSITATRGQQHRSSKLCNGNSEHRANKSTAHSSRVQVVKMLAIVVMMFAVLWLPYRLYVVYNSFASNPFYDLWFRTFCRIMVYTNSAINPILYNAMSVKFRQSFRRLLWCGKQDQMRSMGQTYVNYQQVTTL